MSLCRKLNLEPSLWLCICLTTCFGHIPCLSAYYRKSNSIGMLSCAAVNQPPSPTLSDRLLFEMLYLPPLDPSKLLRGANVWATKKPMYAGHWLNCYRIGRSLLTLPPLNHARIVIKCSIHTLHIPHSVIGVKDNTVFH